MAIKMNATNFQTNKEFRQNVDIRKKIKQGIKKRAIFLPPEDFAYGVPNRPSTPMKNVVNNEYGNVAEEEIKKDYQTFITEKNRRRAGPPKVVPRFINPKVFELRAKEEEKKKQEAEEAALKLDYVPPEEELPPEPEKPLYKLKMFQNVGSKVAEQIKQFKTYQPYKKKNNLDDLIEKVQGEITQAEQLQQGIQQNYQEKQQPVPV